MKRIEKPEFSVGSIDGDKLQIDYWNHQFHTWFTSTIEPLNKMIDGAELIYRGGERGWHFCLDKDDTMQAYIIGREPIKKDTAESLLKEILNDKETEFWRGTNWYKRAKALLEGEND